MILFLYGRMRVTESPYTRMFYAVKYNEKILISGIFSLFYCLHM